MRTVITNAKIVNEGRSFRGSVIIDGDRISEVKEGETTEKYNTGSQQPNDKGCQLPECILTGHDGNPVRIIDAQGCHLLPGIIDDHVHFREPGLTHKADIESESRAAAAGGVTSYFDMPNTVPQTTTAEALEEKFELAAKKSHVNYSFFLGAAHDNIELLRKLRTDGTMASTARRIPGIKLFMGSSTGNMLVDDNDALRQIFSNVEKPLMTHCEDTALINSNMRELEEKLGEEPAVGYHPQIRSAEACYRSTALAVALAKEYQTRLHVAHLSTARELALFNPGNKMITAEATVGHLFFCDEDYARLGTRIKVNPAIKSKDDRDALRRALNDRRIAVVGTDHAPHLLKEKQGGCRKAASGMPMVQFSLPAMLELTDKGILTLPRLAELMCHNPALLFGIKGRGFIRKGYKADIVIVKRGCPWTVNTDIIESKCQWSPLEGHTFNWKVEMTLCNGEAVYQNGKTSDKMYGEEIAFI